MKKINWFPGHMTKALRMMQEEIKKVDAVIYVLDARAPLASVNPSFTDITGDKPILYILNKIDLADTDKIKQVKERFKTDNSDVLELNSTASGALKLVTNSLTKLCEKQINNFKNKGIKYLLRAMVLGVPNSGKSTLVNNLCGSARALTGNKPGVTRGKQWVKLSNNIEILDTPGTLWPNLDNERVARQLAYIGSIKDDVFSSLDLSLYLIEDLLKEYKKDFCDRYFLVEEDVEGKTTVEILEKIGEKRRFLIKGGDIDFDRAAFAVIDDFRKGRIGKITFY